MNRSEKKDFVKKLKEELSSSSSVIVAHYSGITVDETDQLRKEMRNNGMVFGAHTVSHPIISKLNNKQTFVEPYLPNHEIGIMHLAAGLWKNNKDMRVDKSVEIEIKTLKNKTVSKSLRFNN